MRTCPSPHKNQLSASDALTVIDNVASLVCPLVSEEQQRPDYEEVRERHSLSRTAAAREAHAVPALVHAGFLSGSEEMEDGLPLGAKVGSVSRRDP